MLIFVTIATLHMSGMQHVNILTESILSGEETETVHFMRFGFCVLIGIGGGC